MDKSKLEYVEFYKAELGSGNYCTKSFGFAVWRHQQAKVEEQAQEIANLKSLIQGHELRHQQNLSIKQKLTRRSEELQKRVDAALGHLDDVNFPPDYEDAWESFYKAEQALKGEGQ
ncbi:hypothetical protein [Acinetobacter baumannii]|uniref:hypothetical protein n=1 Tax=Acinetobacter baumannii TaxID=470 RepID=UPI001FF65196|nr:hypothetical protein [Acinetobacter baumannii]MCJ9560585.1 hypothetical protein [Acinetobacter baumannii]